MANTNEKMSAATFRASLGLDADRPMDNTVGKPKPVKNPNRSNEKAELRLLIEYFAKNWKLELREEFRFHPKRMWKFDWYFPEVKVAVEFEGLSVGRANISGHLTPVGYTKNCEKYNQAAVMGIKVLRYTALEKIWKQFPDDFTAIVTAGNQKNLKKS